MRRSFPMFLFLLLLAGGGSQTRDFSGGQAQMKEAQMLLDSARYDQALALGQAAYNNFQPSSGPAGDCLMLLGNVFLEKGDLPAALQQYRAALTVFTKCFGPHDLHTAQAINNLGEYFYQKKQHREAEIQFRKSLQLRLSLLGESHELIADSYNNLGNCAVAKGDFSDAFQWHQKALVLRQKVLPPGHPDLATSQNNLGNCLYYSQDYTAAMACFGEALRIRQAVYGPEHPKTAQVLNNLGNCYAALGQRSVAAKYFRQAISIRSRAFGPEYPGLASALENLGDIYYDNGDFIAARDAFTQAYGLLQPVYGDKAPATAVLRHKIGLCYQFEGDYDRALPMHLEAREVLLAAYGKSHSFLAGLNNNLGNCYAAKKDFEAAIHCYLDAANIYRQQSGKGRSDLAQVYNNLGLAYLNQQNSALALDWFKQAEKMLTQSNPVHPDLMLYLKNQGLALQNLGREVEALTTFEHALQAVPFADPMNRLEVWSAQGALLGRRGVQQKDTALLHQSLARFDLALQCADSLRFQMSAGPARQHWLEKQYPVIAGALESCFELWQLTGDQLFLEQTFNLAERNKSLQLLENLHKEQAERFAGLPDSLLEKERYWGEELNRREKNRLGLLARGLQSQADEMEAGISAARQTLNALIADLEIRYPDYYRLKYTRRVVSSAEVRQDLLNGRKQALLEYFVSDSALFVFVITPLEFKGLRLPKDFPLDRWVADFRNSIQDYPSASGPAAKTLSATYVERAFQIYNAVIAPVQAICSLPEQLVIVPDGALAWLPFEALLCAQPKDPQAFKTHHYLFRDYRIQYAYPATHLLELVKNPPPHAPETMLALAPDFENNPYGLQALKHNREEAAVACGMLDGDLLTDTAANCSAFLAQASRHRILLLSTHGKASSAVGELSYLAFSPVPDTEGQSFLYVRDLYLQHLPAELVVLSACETGIGEYRNGEGIISLAKGFFHAGARSVVATLWSVDDAKNADLMVDFFRGIKAGNRKDEALQAAKLNFLGTHSNDEAHPVYWAAAIASGDMAPVEFPGNYWWVLAIAGALAVGLYCWKKRAFLKFD